MNKFIIYQYINRLTKKDIYNFSLKQGIDISNHDIDIIYDYIKNDNIRIINNPKEVLNEIKDKLQKDVYNKILELYDKYKNYLK